jgi:hypothetical protein
MPAYPLATLPPIKDMEPWIAQMLRYPVRARRHVLKRFKPPMPMFLYKYFSSSQPYLHQNLHDVIAGSVLRLNSPSSFNDPFEMAAHFVMMATDDERRSRFESLAREQAPHLGWRAVQARIESLMASDERFFTPVWQQSLKRVREAAGVYCFAGNAKSTLMGSHYASNHRGVGLQFERGHDIETLSHALHVKYVPDLPVLNWVVDFHTGIGEMIFSKHPCWEYEQESRIMVYGQAGRYLPFAPQALRRLIFGCRADAKLVSAVEASLAERAAAGYPTVDVYVATMHPKKYRLVITRKK